jgi:hypothetical protein
MAPNVLVGNTWHPSILGPQRKALWYLWQHTLHPRPTYGISFPEEHCTWHLSTACSALTPLPLAVWLLLQDGLTPLHVAAGSWVQRDGHNKVVEQLLGAGAAIDAAHKVGSRCAGFLICVATGEKVATVDKVGCKQAGNYVGRRCHQLCLHNGACSDNTLLANTEFTLFISTR